MNSFDECEKIKISPEGLSQAKCFDPVFLCIYKSSDKER